MNKQREDMIVERIIDHGFTLTNTIKSYDNESYDHDEKIIEENRRDLTYCFSKEDPLCKIDIRFILLPKSGKSYLKIYINGHMVFGFAPEYYESETYVTKCIEMSNMMADIISQEGLG